MNKLGTIKPEKADIALLCVSIFCGLIIIGTAITSKLLSTQHGLLICEPRGIALGTVQQAEAIPFEFTIHNKEKVPFKITEVIKPCSCASIDVPVDLVIGSMSSQRFSGALRTTDRRGHYDTSVMINYEVQNFQVSHSKAKAKMLLKLPISVEVLPSIKASQEVIEISRAREVLLTLSPGTSNDFAINNIEVSDHFIKYEPLISKLGIRDTHFQVRLRLDKPTDTDAFGSGSGQELGRYWIEFKTSEEMEPSIRLPITIGTDSS